MRILVTGASGFVGQSLCEHITQNYPAITGITPVFRKAQPNALNPTLSPLICPTLLDLANQPGQLKNIDCIIHLAARVHQMDDQSEDPLVAFRAINTEATKILARSAAQASVKRFIYLSSIKVNGEGTGPHQSYTETDTPQPADPYGISKQEAEDHLRQIADETGIEVVIIRPPLVYGPSVKANFLQMMRIVDKGIPLPLGSIHNQRSLIYVENLADAIINSALSPSAANQTFLVSDGHDISTPDLIKQIAFSLNKKSNLLPIPPKLLKMIGQLTGKSDTLDRLTGSLIVDSSKIRQTLNWTPPYTFEQGIQKTCDWYRQSR